MATVDGDDYTYERHDYMPNKRSGVTQVTPEPLMTGYDLVALWRATAEASNSATPANVPGGVYWTNLHCIAAEQYTDHEGNTGRRVWIGGADPDAAGLRAFVTARLAERGFAGVEVMTRWW
jgi:hypothetical protein